jgi:predicted enzyme related to lactoylglutathione lyase
MAKVVGVGGVFFKANDTQKLSDWYKDVLGINMGEWGAVFEPADMPAKSYTAFSLFKADSNYFDVPGKSVQQSFLINLLVDDLDGVLANVASHGGTLIGTPESFDYGKFGWFADPEGNKIELWQPS